ncbi:DivIVA domain-containing protein [Tessaracoccus sp.]
MSLTLEEVRRVRFRMAKRNVSGYEVGDVDTFIDKVEESFTQFENERALRNKEMESNSDFVRIPASTENNDEALAAKERELEELRAELDRLKGEAVASTDGDDNLQRLSSQNDQLVSQNDELRAELAKVRAELDEVRTQRVSEVVGQVQMLKVGTRDDASPAVIRLVQLATEQAEQVMEEADAEAARKLEDAKQQSYEITTDARTKAERVESEARVNAEQMTREANARSSHVDTEANQRRSELFTDLEREQGELTAKVNALRDFEASYRDNLKGYLGRHLDALDQDLPEPEEMPELAQRRESDTPRLDALAQGHDA